MQKAPYTFPQGGRRAVDIEIPSDNVKQYLYQKNKPQTY